MLSRLVLRQFVLKRWSLILMVSQESLFVTNPQRFPQHDIPGVLLHVTEDSKDPYDTYDPSSKWSVLAQGVHSCFTKKSIGFHMHSKLFEPNFLYEKNFSRDV